MTDILSDLSIKIYESPLSEVRSSGRIADVTDPVNVLMLLIDFQTEVEMNGILDFLGNSSGLYARETAEALRFFIATLLGRLQSPLYHSQAKSGRPIFGNLLQSLDEF